MSEVCLGCGCTQSVAEIKAEYPEAVSCCPEREMISTRLANRIEAQAKEIAELENHIADAGKMVEAQAKEIAELRAALSKVRGAIIMGRHNGSATVRLQRVTNPIIDGALRSFKQTGGVNERFIGAATDGRASPVYEQHLPGECL
jgi:septal ring factor EnvC (AmiA/AmiB activator)